MMIDHAVYIILDILPSWQTCSDEFNEENVKYSRRTDDRHRVISRVHKDQSGYTVDTFDTVLKSTLNGRCNDE